MESEDIREKFMRIAGHLDEKTKRLWCANEAISIGWGGITLVSQATGLSRMTITTGIQELTGGNDLSTTAIRRKGGGRKKSPFRKLS